MEAVEFNPEQLRDEWINRFFHREGMFRVYICQLFKNGFLTLKEFADCILEEIEKEGSQGPSVPDWKGPSPKILEVTFDSSTVDMIEVLAQRIVSKHLHNRYSNKKGSALEQFALVVEALLEGPGTRVGQQLVSSTAAGKDPIGRVRPGGLQSRIPKPHPRIKKESV